MSSLGTSSVCVRYQKQSVKANSLTLAHPRGFSRAALLSEKLVSRFMGELSLSVSLYYMRVTERRKPEPQILNAFDGSTDLLDVVHDALKEHQGNSVEIKGGTRRTYITNDLKRKKRVLEGSVEVGNSGYTASIKDVKTNKEMFKQRPDQAHMIPLYVRFWVPEKQRFALAALQHYGDAGCKSSMNSILLGYFHNKFSDYTFAMRQVVPKQYAEKVVKNGAIKELRFIQYGVGKDIANMYGGKGLPAGVANMEVRVVAQNNNQLGWTQWMSQAIQGKRVNLQKGAIEVDSFKCDDFRMRVNFNGKDKMLKVEDFIRLNSRIDVSGEVSMGADGHPDRESISQICEALMAQITKEDTGIDA